MGREHARMSTPNARVASVSTDAFAFKAPTGAKKVDVKGL
jgi:hypothetical protein